VRLKLYRGASAVVGRKGPEQLYRMELATYGRGDQFDQSAAAGFIKLFGMSVRTAAEVQGKLSSLDLDKLLPAELKRLTP
jgi:argininosuccinate synthase